MAREVTTHLIERRKARHARMLKRRAAGTDRRRDRHAAVAPGLYVHGAPRPAQRGTPIGDARLARRLEHCGTCRGSGVLRLVVAPPTAKHPQPNFAHGATLATLSVPCGCTRET